MLHRMNSMDIEGINVLINKFCDNFSQPPPPAQLLPWLCKALSIQTPAEEEDGSSFVPSEAVIDTAYRRWMEITTAIESCERAQQLFTSGAVGDVARQKFQRLKRLVMSWTLFLRSTTVMYTFCNSEDDREIERLWGYSLTRGKLDYTDMQTPQRVLNILKDRIAVRRLMKNRTTQRYYREVFTPEGMCTRAYEDAGSIRDLMWQLCSVDVDPQLEVWFSEKRGTPSFVEEQLVLSYDSRFPEYEPSRTHLSWRNGILDMDKLKFYDHTAPEMAGVICYKYMNQYFDADLLDKEPEEIETPALDVILETQNFLPPHQTMAEEEAAFQAAVQSLSQEERARMVELDQKRVEAADALEQMTQMNGAAVSFTATSLRAAHRALHEANKEFRRFMSDLSNAGKIPPRRCQVCAELYSKEHMANVPALERRRLYEGIYELDTHANFVVHPADTHYTFECEQAGEPGWVLQAFIARSWFPLGAKENGGVAGFGKGKAGTGKNLLGNIMSMALNDEDVGILSSNCQETFAMEPLVGRRFWWTPELKKKSNIPMGELQELITGGTIEAVRKGKGNQRWKADCHGFMFGNEVPYSWLDGQKSLIRRFIVWIFCNIPRVVDENLMHKLRQEFDRIMVKCIKYYFRLVEKSKSVNPLTGKAYSMRGVLGQYFINTSFALASQVHPLRQFINEQKAMAYIVTGSLDLYMPFELFTSMFGNHLRRSGGRANIAFDEDFYGYVFSEEGVSVVDNVKRQWPPESGNDLRTRYLLGIGVDPENMERIQQMYPKHFSTNFQQ